MDIHAIVTDKIIICLKAASYRGAGRGPQPDCRATL